MNDRFFKAVRENDVSTLEKLLHGKESVDVMSIQDDNGESLLHSAVTHGCLGMVQFLIQKNNNPQFLSVPDRTGTTVLMQSAGSGDPKMFSILLSYDRNGESKKQYKGEEKNGLLHLLVLRPANQINFELTSAIQYAIDFGCDINLRNGEGRTPLHLAALTGNEEIVKLLLKRNANFSLEDNTGLTPCQLALKEGRTKVVELLSNRQSLAGSSLSSSSSSLSAGTEPDSPKVLSSSLSLCANSSAQSISSAAELLTQSSPIESLHQLSEPVKRTIDNTIDQSSNSSISKSAQSGGGSGNSQRKSSRGIPTPSGIATSGGVHDHRPLSPVFPLARSASTTIGSRPPPRTTKSPLMLRRHGVSTVDGEYKVPPFSLGSEMESTSEPNLKGVVPRPARSQLLHQDNKITAAATALSTLFTSLDFSSISSIDLKSEPKHLTPSPRRRSPTNTPRSPRSPGSQRRFMTPQSSPVPDTHLISGAGEAQVYDEDEKLMYEDIMTVFIGLEELVKNHFRTCVEKEEQELQRNNHSKAQIQRYKAIIRQLQQNKHQQSISPRSSEGDCLSINLDDEKEDQDDNVNQKSPKCDTQKTEQEAEKEGEALEKKLNKLRKTTIKQRSEILPLFEEGIERLKLYKTQHIDGEDDEWFEVADDELDEQDANGWVYIDNTEPSSPSSDSVKYSITEPQNVMNESQAEKIFSSEPSTPLDNNSSINTPSSSTPSVPPLPLLPSYSSLFNAAAPGETPISPPSLKNSARGACSPFRPLESPGAGGGMISSPGRNVHALPSPPSLALIRQPSVRIKYKPEDKRKPSENDEWEMVIKEIISSETTFVSNIKKAIQCFLNPMRVFFPKRREHCVAIFSNLESILICNQQLLVNLEASPHDVGSVFLDMAPWVLSPYMTYINNFSLSLRTRIDLQQDDEWLKFLMDVEKKAGDMLDSFLIQPVQRAPRYEMLLKDLLKKLPPRTPSMNRMTITQAYEKVKELTTTINETKRASDNLDKIIQIQLSLQEADCLNLVESHRKLIQEGTMVLYTEPGVKNDYNFFLFNDLLLYTSFSALTGKHSIGGYMQFEKAVVIKAPDLDELLQIGIKSDMASCAFQMHHPNKVHTFVCSKTEIKEIWVNALKAQIDIIYTRGPIKSNFIVSDALRQSKKEGWMLKRGTVVDSRLYCRLKGKTLYFYNKKEVHHARWSISLDSSWKVEEVRPLNRGRPSFRLIQNENSSVFSPSSTRMI
eukprot:TRINITY_DN2265_c1_g1_i1.p1 TRINITY_DN2265_c1_g1~~TRINITY_DN2265_c1_g1_i1.p1  ORF type:complete len:1281 (-),score=302.08 TRINITY_DN2265_c1_g1_i1:129-3809(-)